VHKSITEPHKTSLDELFANLGSSPDGLTGEQVRDRLRAYGKNELRVRRATPEIIKFLRQFKNFFALLLMVGGALALLAERLDPGQGNLYIAYALLGVVVLNAAFTYAQEHQSEKIMESFKKLLPSMATVQRDGEVQRLEAKFLVPGDVIRLAEGDRIPADGRLIEESLLRVDISGLTGESEPQRLRVDATSEQLLDSRNMVFSGSMVQSGTGKVMVSNTGMSTQMGDIVKLTKETKEVPTPIHRELTHFIKVISSIAITLGVLFFLVSVGIGKGPIVSLIFAIGIIVANVPEGLLPTVTLSLTMASKRMAGKMALIKNLESVETLGSTTVICTDKTGTLTQNRLAVSTLVINGHEHAADSLAVLDEEGLEDLWNVMTLCNNANLTGDGYAGDPTEGALLEFAHTIRPITGTGEGSRISEQPFDSTRKWMAVVCPRPDGKGPRSYMKGAPEIVLDMCDRVLIDGEVLDMTDERQAHVLADYQRLAGRGERGLAFASINAEDESISEKGYVFLAITGMRDPPRPEVPDALTKCRTAGIRVIMMTGDNGLTAETIARQIGMISGHGTIVNGADLEAMNDDDLDRVLGNDSLIFARISPVQKLRIVQALQRAGEVVTVTGDGVNDAPALKNADMGVAMGIVGTDVAKEASNMVLMDDNFATIVVAVEEGRAIFENIKKFVAYILTSNIPEILPFIAFVLLDIPLPLTVVLILSIDLGTDIVPALGLGAERPESDVMHKPPRARDERLLTNKMLGMSYGIIGMVQAAAGFFSFFVILNAGGWQWGEALASNDALYRMAVTGFFASIIICQIADVIICRTRRQSLLTVGVFSNHLVLFGIATELLLLSMISYIPAFNTFFGTAPLQAWQLSLSIPFALLILFGDEIRRVFVRRGNPFVLRWLTW
jgi:sodium/potassium-transporting ATPase subunit alpha